MLLCRSRAYEHGQCRYLEVLVSQLAEESEVQCVNLFLLRKPVSHQTETLS